MAAHEQLSPEAWEALLRKRLYYAGEIAKIIHEFPPEQARKAHEVIESFWGTHNIETYIAEMDKIPTLNRLSLLLKKYVDSLCCFRCGLTALLASFLEAKVSAEAPSTTLH